MVTGDLPAGIIAHPELTIDLDFWYNPTIENFYKLTEALADLEVDTTELKLTTFNPKSTYLKIPHDTSIQTSFRLFLV